MAWPGVVVEVVWRGSVTMYAMAMSQRLTASRVPNCDIDPKRGVPPALAMGTEKGQNGFIGSLIGGSGLA